MNYSCYFCGRQHVKLWRLISCTSPLICATCAEARQFPEEYPECIWIKISDSEYEGILTGNYLYMPRWFVDEKGYIPSPIFGIGPTGHPLAKTNNLTIDISNCHYGKPQGSTMVPALSNGNGIFFSYNTVSEELRKNWEDLPTR